MLYFKYHQQTEEKMDHKISTSQLQEVLEHSKKHFGEDIQEEIMFCLASGGMIEHSGNWRLFIRKGKDATIISVSDFAEYKCIHNDGCVLCEMNISRMNGL